MVSKNLSLVAGVPELVVFSLLSSRVMYWYEIALAIKTVTKEALSLGEGVLYPALPAMGARGLVRTRSLSVDGRKRIYYNPTARGKTRLARLTQNWRRMNLGVEAVLGNLDHG